jgi:hypothetical protein
MPPAPPYPLPAKVVQTVAQRNAAADELDLTMTLENGEVYHAWYRGKATGWIGCEKIAGP